MADQHQIAYGTDDASVVVDADQGARLASLTIRGHELLVTADDDPMGWGCYPMVPWAGRVADGQFEFDGEHHDLPIDFAPHAIHGTGYRRPWEQTGPTRFELELREDWPFGGRAVHEVDLGPGGLTLVLEVHAADRAMPAMAGWHPWFRRSVSGSPAELVFDPEVMYERDDRHLPTGRLVEPTEGPWDDCFTDVGSSPRLRWDAVGEIELSSTCDHWVVYDEPAHAVCVEPQTGPPDEFNRGPHVIEPGASLRAEFNIRWETP